MSRDDQGYFEERYVSGRPPWDTGVPSAELIRVLDAENLPRSGCTVLELGCGTGTDAIELARRGYIVTAVDFVPAAIREARRKVRAAAVPVDLLEGDLTRIDLGGPYDMLFDRGLYHHMRRANLSGFLQTMEKITRKGTRWLCLAGNAREQTEQGPPRVHEHEFRAELGGLFEFLDVREFRLGPETRRSRPLAWSILMERRA
jgi:SAM-dependent methyltransferase